MARAGAERAEIAEAARSEQQPKIVTPEPDSDCPEQPVPKQTTLRNAAPSSCPGMCHGSSGFDPGEVLQLQKARGSRKMARLC